jgi:hypothetical protein
MKVNETNETPKLPAIEVTLTDESAAHCLKLVFRARDCEEPLEIFLHTVQAIELQYQLSRAICELHHRDSQTLLRAKLGGRGGRVSRMVAEQRELREFLGELSKNWTP